MPIWVDKAHDVATAAEVPAAARAVNRMCELDSYEKRTIPDVTVRGDIIAYASPDSTYAVTKKLFDAAKKSILIGIYDFSSPSDCMSAPWVHSHRCRRSRLRWAQR